MFVFAAGPIPLRIREAEIPVVSENECIRKINAVTEKVFILPASSFCAGGENGHDACQVCFLPVLELSVLNFRFLTFGFELSFLFLKLLVFN